MSDQPRVSYAQNGEDVILWRTLGHVQDGRFVDVGGWDPDEDSVTRLFYDQGWRGIDIEPVPDLAERFRVRRPLDEVVQAVISSGTADTASLHRFGGTGLSTLVDQVAAAHEESGLDQEIIEVRARRLDEVLEASSIIDEAIHFLKIDVEGAEGDVLASVDLRRWRPWVLVVEATAPNAPTPTHAEWEPVVLAAGYTYALFDGLSRYYLSPDHLDLLPQLSYPACVLDGFEPAAQAELREQVSARTEELTEARAQTLQWRNRAVSYWAESMAAAQRSADTAIEADHEAASLRVQMARLRETLTEARTERDRLRSRVKRLDARVAALKDAEPDAAPPSSSGLHGLVSRVRRGAGS